MFGSITYASTEYGSTPQYGSASTRTTSQPATADIIARQSKTTTARSRIANSYYRTMQSHGRISQSRTKIQTAHSRILVNGISFTIQTAKSHIATGAYHTQTATAHLLSDQFKFTQSATASLITNTFVSVPIYLDTNATGSSITLDADDGEITLW